MDGEWAQGEESRGKVPVAESTMAAGCSVTTGSQVWVGLYL